MENYYKFLRSWRDMENRINEYRQNKKVGEGEKVVLSDINLWHSDIYAIKVELHDHKETVQAETDTESEAINDSLPEMSADDQTTEPVEESNAFLAVNKRILSVRLEKIDIRKLQNTKRHNTGRHNTKRRKRKPKDQIFHCASCNFHTFYKRSLRIHLARHRIPSEKACELEFNSRCNFCGHRFRTESDLAAHLKRGHVMQFCPLCSYKTDRSGDFARHKLMHKSPSELKMYKCHTCQFESKHKRSIVLHMVLHREPAERYKCSLCPYEGKTKYLLSRHMKSHSQKPQTQRCSKCSYTTHQPSLLNMHMLTHKPRGAVETFICKETGCGYITKWRSALKKHSSTHKEVFKCVQCEFETRVKKSLARHLLSHGKGVAVEGNVEQEELQTAETLEITPCELGNNSM